MKVFLKSLLVLSEGALFAALVGETGFSADHVISQKGKTFSKDSITVAVGDTITFKNDDDTTHNVFSTSDGFKFNLGVQKEGAESQQKFDKAGEAEVRCAIHPKMKLKVVVK